jgi:DNA/RNA-binding domain of Phe-tRNA-synthetase-like protein
MEAFTISDAWRAAYPGAAVGALVMEGVANPAQHAGLDRRKKDLEARLRARYSGYDRAALRALPVLQAYHAYYKQFKKTYHVQLQLESVVLQGKSIPRVATLVEAMFMAELEDLLLTAGHDLALVEEPVGVHVAGGSERFTRLSGQEQQLKAGDMYIADARGILSSVIYGPDRRTQIRPETQQVIFTAYAPPGVGADLVQRHLNNIQESVLLIAPGAGTVLRHVYPAG